MNLTPLPAGGEGVSRGRGTRSGVYAWRRRLLGGMLPKDLSQF
jgi:hypothetical protein